MKTSLTVWAICLLSFTSMFSQGHKVSGTAVMNNYDDSLEYKNLLVMLINKPDSIAIDSVYVLTDSLGNYCFNDVQRTGCQQAVFRLKNVFFAYWSFT